MRTRGFMIAMLLAAGLPLLAAKLAPQDPYDLDPGEKQDQAGFVDWVRRPHVAPRHPLDCLQAVVHTNKIQTNDYFQFFNGQTGLTGGNALLARRLAEYLYQRAPLANTEGLGLEDQKKLKDSGEVIVKAADEFFAKVPRETRVRVYLVSEKFEAARLATLDLVRMGQSEVTDAWLAKVKDDDMRAGQGYLFGVCRDRDDAGVARALADYRLTVDFLLTFVGPPPYLHGKDRDAFRMRKRKQRAQILRSLAPLTL